MHVSATDHSIIVSQDGRSKTVQFNGTRLAGDNGTKRSVYRVAMRWATLTGTSEACANAAWRKLQLGRLPAPSRLCEDDWSDILSALDSEIADMVNDPSSKFYIYG